jgi:hypothetical protein
MKIWKQNRSQRLISVILPTGKPEISKIAVPAWKKGPQYPFSTNKKLGDTVVCTSQL